MDLTKGSYSEQEEEEEGRKEGERRPNIFFFKEGSRSPQF